jgi:hypothetical protein
MVHIDISPLAINIIRLTMKEGYGTTKLITSTYGMLRRVAKFKYMGMMPAN